MLNTALVRRVSTKKQRILVQSPRFVPTDIMELSPALQQPLRLQNWFCARAAHHKANSDPHMTHTCPTQGCTQGDGPGLPKARAQCPSWAIAARALEGVSLLQQHTAPLHGMSVTSHKAALPFPSIPFGDTRVHLLSCCSLGVDVAEDAHLTNSLFQ